MEDDPIITRAQARPLYFGGVNRTTLQRWEKAGKVPPPIRISQRVVGWRRSTLEAWLESRKAGVRHEQK